MLKLNLRSVSSCSSFIFLSCIIRLLCDIEYECLCYTFKDPFFGIIAGFLVSKGKQFTDPLLLLIEKFNQQNKVENGLNIENYPLIQFFFFETISNIYGLFHTKLIVNQL